MTRTVRALGVLLAASLSVQVGSGAAVSGVSIPEYPRAIHSFDGPYVAAALSETHCDRGPPVTACASATPRYTIGHRSHGTFVHPEAAAPDAIAACAHGYDATARPVRTDRTKSTTEGQVGVSSGNPAFAARSAVAAKTPIGFAEGLGHTALTPG